MYMDDIKLFTKKKKRKKNWSQTVKIYSHDIGMEFSIEKCAMLIMKNWRIDNRRYRTAESGKHQNA